MQLKSIWFENVNFNLMGVKKVINACEKMKNLTEFRLINIETAKHPSVLAELYSTFKHHDSLEILDLSNNNLRDYFDIIHIMENNRRISVLNVRGSKMTPDNIGYMWLGLRQNTSITDFRFQRERVVFAFDTL